MVLGVAVLAARHFGPTISLLAGAVQATTAWTVLRGRLAEADVLLACLIVWSIVAFDEMLAPAAHDGPDNPGNPAPRWRRARWLFFGLLGATSLAKGIGFGAVIVMSIVAGMLFWQRDRITLRRLWFPAGWLLAFAIAFSWPLLMIVCHGGGAVTLWLMHVTDRLSGPTGPGPFASEPWWEYVPTLLAQALPWTPFAFAGSCRSLRRAFSRVARVVRPANRQGQNQLPAIVVAGDRLLWVWTAVPLALLSMATVKNAHYAIAAQVPWSIWTALELARLGETLRRRGWRRSKLRFAACAGFASLALALRYLPLADRAWLRSPGRRMGILRIRRRNAPQNDSARPPLRRLGPPPVRVSLRLISPRPCRSPLLLGAPRLLAPGQQLSARDQPRRALPRSRSSPVRRHDQPLRPGSSRVCCRRPRSRLTRARETRSCRNPRPRTNHPERPSVLTFPHLTRPGRKQPRPPGQVIDSALNP